jgi:hypothetical protein
MFRPLVIVFALSLAALLALFPKAAAGAEPANIFPQGSFELLEGGAPKGWTLLPGAELKAEGDNHYLQFTGVEGKDSAWALATLPLDPEWSTLKVSARLKVTNLKCGPEGWHKANCILNFRTAEGKDAGYPGGPSLSADSDWGTQTVTVDIPKNAASLHLQPGLWASAGVMCLDDVTITPVERPGLFSGPIVRLDRETGFREGTFEMLSADGAQAQGWSEWPLVAQLAEHDGNHWLRISNSNTKAMPAIRANVRLPSGCQSVRVSARLKASGLRCGREPWQNARVVISPCRADGQPLGSLPGPALTQDSDWQTVETTLALAAETRYLLLWVGLWQATGVLEVDDVQVWVVE